jgi:hypothetical protein
VQCWGAKSFADDLVTGRGVVLSRAATTLRSVETKLRCTRWSSYGFEHRYWGSAGQCHSEPGPRYPEWFAHFCVSIIMRPGNASYPSLRRHERLVPMQQCYRLRSRYLRAMHVHSTHQHEPEDA